MKPVLVVMAAGMGSRYGGLKQMDPLGPSGQILMDYSIYDAMQAGFEKVIFVIKPEMKEQFEQMVGNRIAGFVEVAYCFQQVTDVPKSITVPEGREKPWGTAHAVLAAKSEINGPFAVINADDYYGPEAFKLLFQTLQTAQDGQKYAYSMVGYQLGNTLTENGAVARGICEINENNTLKSVTERTRIEKKNSGAAYSENEGKAWIPISENSVVSMNMWGFTESFLQELQNGFVPFLQEALRENPLKAEYFLPTVVSRLINAEKAEVTVLKSADKWYGVTYKQDKPVVQAALKNMHAKGLYPEKMLGLV